MVPSIRVQRQSELEMDPTYPLVPIANFICFFLVLVPFMTSNLRTNVGVCLYGFWVSIACFIRGVNSIVWSDNANDSASVWCDIGKRKVLCTTSTGMQSLKRLTFSNKARRRKFRRRSCLLACYNAAALFNYSHERDTPPRPLCAYT